MLLSPSVRWPLPINFGIPSNPVGASGLKLKPWGLGFTTLGFTADWDSQEILGQGPIRRVESQA